ncbi:MAG TPA: hypothetical protein VGJ09_05195 [Bryobacteraceae bacterium]|jgi:hypothetical protein
MPLQNRVDPSGTIFASAARGTFLGNRGGALHNANREIVRPYASRRWITCLLEFKGRRRSVMSPGQYTELFFLDEAVALAAGHRPCAECRRNRFNAFKDAWIRAGEPRAANALLADEMDQELHRARIDRQKGKITWQAALHSLPDGCFVQIDGASYLVWDRTLLLWSPEGYRNKRKFADNLTVTVLTPEPIVRCLRQGYIPEIHASSLPALPFI